MKALLLFIAYVRASTRPRRPSKIGLPALPPTSRPSRLVLAPSCQARITLDDASLAHPHPFGQHIVFPAFPHFVQDSATPSPVPPPPPRPPSLTWTIAVASSIPPVGCPQNSQTADPVKIAVTASCPSVRSPHGALLPLEVLAGPEKASLGLALVPLLPPLWPRQTPFSSSDPPGAAPALGPFILCPHVLCLDRPPPRLITDLTLTPQLLRFYLLGASPPWLAGYPSKNNSSCPCFVFFP